MNSKLKTKKVALFIISAFLLTSFNAVWANDNDDHALWTSFEMTKKINKKFKVGAEFEYRTKDYLKDIERFSAGVNLQYKITEWLKATAGHIFILGYNNSETKTHFDDKVDPPVEDGWNYEHSYWEKRNRVYLAITGETKIGRFKLSLRERLQYTRTHAEIIEEDKHRFGIEVKEEYDALGNISGTKTVVNWEDPVTELETKKHKNNTVLRSRFTVKYDIPKCKITPFASFELYSRVDKWKNYDKFRARIGASYSINKDNAIELYYLCEKFEKKGSGDTHVIGVGYSLDL